ncbi:N-acetylmuramidase family protein [Crenobacter sp. SG2303]|uniref:N-acetylmuramidase family protein n=1 Tax=Crenobacter oryzisoli TaxID=3056844 RepID=A0ABT7XPV4_9NEIS|nr:N-acetylmuramidase family protein [Crenobacter sp. SG2303]MDN0075594.1 N-acetylmuramidase family protein [Crenobacter sp. SG2303]
MVLTIGSKGQDVSELQRLLVTAGAKLVVDGDYGQATAKAVAAYQKKSGLLVDGKAGPHTLDALRAGTRNARSLTDADIRRAAKRLDLPASRVRAVCEVESAGMGFTALGNPVVLFERHVFYQRLAAAGRDVEALAERYPALVNKQRGGYTGGPAEWARLNTACTIDRLAALESASWGRFQIMGYHWDALGYASADEFATLMKQDEGQHLDAFVRFLLINPLMLRALREGRWAAFARLYNGPRYSENLYDVKLERADQRFARAIERAVK